MEKADFKRMINKIAKNFAKHQVTYSQSQDIFKEIRKKLELKPGGFAFERLCLAHIPQIKMALGISGVYTEESAWRHKGSAKETGVQIDLIIDRDDKAINVCEIKFSEDQYTIKNMQKI